MALSDAIKLAKNKKYAIIGGQQDDTPASAGVHYTQTQGPYETALTPDTAPIHHTNTLGPDSILPESAGIHYTSTLGPGDVGMEHSPTAGMTSSGSYKRAARTFDQTPFRRTSFRPSQETYVRPEYEAPEAYVRPEYTQPEAYVRPEFQTSELTKDYLDRLKAEEGNAPDPYKSKYEGAIQSILDGILGQKGPYTIKDDINYNLLYEQARESAMANGNKAMRDAMGNMQTQTGGYGSTAAMAAGSQAYDNYLQSLNEQNPQLASLAYQMWRDRMNDQYNQLNAAQGVENTDYARHRDMVNDWLNNRNYLANQAQQAYANDRNAYQYDTSFDYGQWQDAANRSWDQYQYGTNMDYNQWQYLNDLDWQKYQYENNMDYNTWQTMMDLAERQYEFDTNADWNEYSFGANMDYQRGRDEIGDYDNALTRALQWAQAGRQVPAQYAKYLDDDTMAQLNALSAQVLAAQAGTGTGSRSGRRPSSGNSDSGDVRKGMPYGVGNGDGSNQIGWLQQKTYVKHLANEAANAMDDNGAAANARRFMVIENAADNGVITPEQGVELLDEFGIDASLANKDETLKKLNKQKDLKFRNTL